jgi:hypothetical protein
LDANNFKDKMWRFAFFPRDSVITLESLLNNRFTGIAELRAMIPKTGGKPKLVRLSIYLNINPLPRTIKESSPILTPHPYTVCSL